MRPPRSSVKLTRLDEAFSRAPRAIASCTRSGRMLAGPCMALARNPLRNRPVAKAPISSASVMASRMMPRPSATARSPRLVSSAMAVVMTRVWPAMLPPTMMTAPTSALARPKPASSAVSRLKRPSHSSVGMARQAEEPSERRWSSYSAHRSSTTWRVSETTIGVTSTACAIDHRGRREEQAERAERAGARQEQIDGEPRHHRRQPHQGVEEHDHRGAAGKAQKASAAPSGRPTRLAISTALSVTFSDRSTIPARAGSRPSTRCRAVEKGLLSFICRRFLAPIMDLTLVFTSSVDSAVQSHESA